MYAPSQSLTAGPHDALNVILRRKIGVSPKTPDPAANFLSESVWSRSIPMKNPQSACRFTSQHGCDGSNAGGAFAPPCRSLSVDPATTKSARYLRAAFTVIIAMLALALPTAHAQTSITVGDASFETPALTGGTWQSGPSGSAWTFVSGAGLSTNGSGFTGNNANAPAGSQVAYLQGVGGISQSISGLTASTSYTITFAAAQRATGTAATWSVKVDGTEIKAFDPGAAATSYVDYSASFTATASSHTISIVGTDVHSGDRTVFVDNVRIVSAGSSGSGLKADYFTNTALTGAAALTRTDSTVDFTWNGAAPGSGVSGSNFSARWSGQVQPQYTENYTFITTSDDGVRLWVNGTQLINNWTNHGSTQDAGGINLVAGQKYDIVMEYFQGDGGSQASLSWSSPSQATQIIPSTRLYPAVNGLNGDYYNTWDLSGSIITTRVDSTVDFTWTGYAPAPGLNTDGVSVRWTGQVKPQYTETYTFYTNTDDGVRLWVNNVQLINDYTGHAPTENSGTITLTGGQKYDIKMEYYQGGGGAVAELRWSSASTTKAIIPQNVLYPAVVGTGLKAEYFGNSSLTGTAAITRTDAIVDNNWGGSSPDASLPVDSFSVRWSGQVKADFTETYTFYTNSDDGVRLWVNGVALINNWTGHAPTEDSSTIALTAGQKYDIKMEYQELGGGAVAQLSWSSASVSKAIIPQTSLYPVISGSGTTGPAAPTGLSANSSWNARADVAWTRNSTDETGFKLERKTGLNGTYAQIAVIPATWTSCIDNTVSAGTLYYYRIRATNASGDSAYSNEGTATTTGSAGSVPTAPSSLTADSTFPDHVDLAWTRNSTDETGFRLERKIGSGGTYSTHIAIPAGWTSCRDEGTSGSTTYYYRIIASNAAGDSTYSNEVSVTTPAAPVTSPNPPSNLVAVSNWVGRADLAWTDNATNETGFKLERKTGLGGTYAEIQSIPADWTSVMDNTVSGGTLYYYRIRATNASGDSSYSNEAIVTTYSTGSVPTAPTIGSATASSSSRISVGWSDNSSNETGFKVERKQGSGGTYAQITTTGANVTNYQDDGLAASTQYYYRVRATNGTGDSVYSGEANATTQAPAALGIPSGLGATATSSTQITLGWTDNAIGETGFKVERKLGAGGAYAQIGTASANATSYNDSGLTASTLYYYRVRATGSSSDSDYSNEAYSTTNSNISGSVSLVGVDFTKNKLSDPFWAPRIESNRTVSLPIMYQSFVNNNNLANFNKTWTGQGYHDGFPWADSDVYKTLEGMAAAVSLHTAGYGADGTDNDLKSKLNNTITDIVKAQNAGGDGYLDTYIQMGVQGRDQGGNTTVGRWAGYLWAHEDYCMGHMMEAAIAHYEMTGKSDSTFLNVARSNANYLAAKIPSTYNVIPGHQEVEIALMRLYDLQGNASDLNQAKYYIDERGRFSNGRPIYGEFCQDVHQLRDEVSPDGHAVRGIYMWNGATRVGAATSDTALLSHMTTLWDNVVNKKMYATGGTGHGLYTEGFGPDYDLSNYYAYNETCAAVAMMQWSNVLGNLYGDGKYNDVLERVMYNGFASGRALDGTRMYYNNQMTRTGTKGREGIVCCATNIVRTTPQIPGYQYAVKGGDGVWTHLYMAGSASMSFGSISNLTLQQTTNYPWDGAVALKVAAITGSGSFNIHLRIPAWASGATVNVNGTPLSPTVSNGYITINRSWAVNDTINLSMPMDVRRVSMGSDVTADIGRVAIMRGPIVYCLESTDNSTDVHQIVIPSGATINVSSYSGSDLGGIVRLSGTGINAQGGGSTTFTMIPYGLWDNRNGHQFNTDIEVMIPESATDAVVKNSRSQEANATSITSSHFNSGGWREDPTALNDGVLPVSMNGVNASNDNTINRATWYPSKGNAEWVQYDFPSNRTFNRADMFWFDDGGEVKTPQSTWISYWNGSAWVNATLDADYNATNDVTSGDRFCILRFAPVTTSKIRLNVQCKPGVSAGVLEWRLP